MPNLAHIVIAGGDTSAAIDRLEALHTAGFAGLAVSSGRDVANYVRDRDPDVVLFDTPFEDVDTFDVVAALKRNPATSHVPLMMLAGTSEGSQRDRALAAGIDDLVQGPAELEVIVARLRPLTRLSTMHAELRRRVRTAGEFGVRVDYPDPATVSLDSCRLLVVGGSKPTAEGMARALEADGFEVLREADPYAAGEQVERERFDAVIALVDEKAGRERSLFFCSHVRNKPVLFNLPVLFLSDQEARRAPVEPYLRGASVAMPLSPLDLQSIETAVRILVRRQRLRWNLRDPILATLRTETADALKGVYSRAFLDRHLASLIAAGSRRRRNLGVALFSIQNAPGIAEQYGQPAQDALLQHMANWISGLVRVEDMTARVDDLSFCAVLPDTAERDAERAAHRIAGVLHHTDFRLGDAVPDPVRVWVQTGVAAAAQDDTVESLLARARGALE